jgi:Dual specificity phosphatase, catalytic domain
LQTVPTCPCLYKNSFTYYETSTSDPPTFEECAAFLDAVQAAGAKVLVHCMSGNSRSPSIALFYLMRTYQQTLEQSYTYLKAKRPSISFNEKDAGRTIEVESQLLGDRASRFNLPIGKQRTAAMAGGGGGPPGMGAPSFASFIQQQQQQHNHGAMAIDSSIYNHDGAGGAFGGGGLPQPGLGFAFGAPPQ